MTVTNFYKQNVYDPSDVKIGEINDVLVGKDGKLVAFVIGIGGFLGVDQKDVAVPFNSIRATWRRDLGRPDSDAALPFNSSRAIRREGKWWLTMNAAKESLEERARLQVRRGQGDLGAGVTWCNNQKSELARRLSSLSRTGQSTSAPPAAFYRYRSRAAF
jgi:hypothetical protein